MGLMRFLVHPEELLDDWQEVHRAYVSGLDGRVYPTRVEIAGNVVTCRRPHSDSGKLHVPWPVNGCGRPVVTTTSLRERDEPYFLPLELARGALSQLREQCASWQLLQMATPAEYHAVEREAFRLFSRATTVQHDPQESSRLSQQSIGRTFAASAILVDSYIQQRQAMRRHTSGHSSTLLGCTLDRTFCESPLAANLDDVFNSVVIPVEWRSIEPGEGRYEWDDLDRLVDHCERRKMIVHGGPLIDLGPQGMPEWLASWQEDFINLQSFVCDFIETAVSRYTGRVRIWEVSAHANTGVALSLGEENRLALAVRTLETASRTDSDSQFFVRVDQPWSEYQARGQHRLSAFQFVDALIRSNIGLHGVNLEVSLGFQPRGSMMRNLLCVSRMIDYWSQLGVQLHVTLAVPSSEQDDPLADEDQEVDGRAFPDRWSEEAQAHLVSEMVRLLSAKPAVTGIFWSHFRDSQRHQFPNAGLTDHDDRPKAVLNVFRRLQHGETDSPGWS